MNKFMRMAAMLLVLVTVMAFVACTPTENETTGNTDPSHSSNTSASESTAPSTKPAKEVTFRVKVVDEEGNIVPGVTVQLCKESCVTKTTNDEGWAEFTNDVEDGYHANIYGLHPEKCPVTVPEGKVIDATEYDFAAGETELTIVLKFVDAPAAEA